MCAQVNKESSSYGAPANFQSQPTTGGGNLPETMALRASRSLLAGKAALAPLLTASPGALPTAAGAPATAVATHSFLSPVQHSKGFASLAGQVSEGILSSKSTPELTEYLERNVKSLTPRSACTALVRLAFVGAHYPGERDLTNRLGVLLPSLVGMIPSMDAESQKQAKAVVDRFKKAGWQL